VDLAQLFEDRIRALRRAAREDHDALAVKRGLNDVAHPLGKRAARNVVVELARFVLLDVRRRRLDLHDVRAELASDVRGVRADIERGLAVLRELAAARVRPDHGGQAHVARLGDQVTDLLVHVVAEAGARINREADRGAAEAQRIFHAAGHRRVRLRGAAERVAVVDLEDHRQASGVLVRDAFDEAERRRVCVAAGLDRHARVVLGVVARGVRREAARGAVLEALVDRQDDELAGAGERARVQEAAQVRAHARGLVLVVLKD
jgi:hypothetical protein